MVQALATQTYSPDEYLALEVESLERHEYINGEMVLMTGGTPNHNRIALNLASELRFALKRQPYSIFIADQRLWLPAANIYTYPDVMVMAEPIETMPNRKDTVMNPLLIAEVLSKSTQSYDRIEKFAAYRTMAQFQEYLLLDQSSYSVEQYIKQAPNQWLFVEHKGAEATIALRSVEVELSMADLYDKVEFEPEVAESATEER